MSSPFGTRDPWASADPHQKEDRWYRLQHLTIARASLVAGVVGAAFTLLAWLWPDPLKKVAEGDAGLSPTAQEGDSEVQPGEGGSPQGTSPTTTSGTPISTSPELAPLTGAAEPAGHQGSKPRIIWIVAVLAAEEDAPDPASTNSKDAEEPLPPSTAVEMASQPEELHESTESADPATSALPPREELEPSDEPSVLPLDTQRIDDSVYVLQGERTRARPKVKLRAPEPPSDSLISLLSGGCIRCVVEVDKAGQAKSHCSADLSNLPEFLLRRAREIVEGAAWEPAQCGAVTCEDKVVVEFRWSMSERENR